MGHLMTRIILTNQGRFNLILSSVGTGKRIYLRCDSQALYGGSLSSIPRRSWGNFFLNLTRGGVKRPRGLEIISHQPHKKFGWRGLKVSESQGFEIIFPQPHKKWGEESLGLRILG